MFIVVVGLFLVGFSSYCIDRIDCGSLVKLIKKKCPNFLNYLANFS